MARKRKTGKALPAAEAALQATDAPIEETAATPACPAAPVPEAAPVEGQSTAAPEGAPVPVAVEKGGEAPLAPPAAAAPSAPIQCQKDSFRLFLAGLWAALVALPDRLAAWLASTAVGKFFYGYETTCTLLEESRLASLCQNSRVYGRLRPFRIRLANTVAHSRVLAAARDAAALLRHTETRIYGVLFGTFGIYTILVWVIRYFATYTQNADYSVLITGIVILVLSLPLLLMARPLCATVQESAILSVLLYRFVGLPRHTYVRGHHAVMNGTVAFLGGSALGILVFFVHPLWILASLGCLLAFFLLLSSPELCLFSGLFLSPFLILTEGPSFVLAVVAALGLLSFFTKVLLGKRIFSFGPVDMAVLLLIFWHVVAAFFSYGGSSSVTLALQHALLIGGAYFLSAGLLNTAAQVERAVNALLSGGVVVAALGLFQQLTGNTLAAWLDNALYARISERITTVFADPSVLGVYLILLIPFTLARMLHRESHPLSRFSACLSCLVLMVAVIYTCSRGAWIGILVALLVFLVACNPHMLYLVIPVAVCIPFLWQQGESPFGALSGATTVVSSTASYRSQVWRGVWAMLNDRPFGGIGAGQDAFCALYPYYALSGAEGAIHSYNLFLQLWCEGGLVAPLLFGLFLLALYQCLLTHRRAEGNDTLRLYNIAAGCGMLAVLVNGLMDAVFYNSRVMFIFYAIAGVAVALPRVGAAEKKRHAPIQGLDGTAAEYEFQVA